MLGTNPVASPFNVTGGLLVHSLWLTLQGEGPDSGRPAIFLRLAHCNLRCSWCDTEFDVGRQSMQFGEIMYRILSIKPASCNLLVITGGEPLLQDITPLVKECTFKGIQVSVETAGTVWRQQFGDWFGTGGGPHKIVCSPKTPKLNEELIPHVHSFKYIIKAGEVDAEDGLPIMSTQIPGQYSRLFRPPPGVPVYVQPCDENDPGKNKANLQQCIASCLKHGHTLSLQVHKICELP